MANIYLCDVQFIIKTHKEKTPTLGQTRKLVLNLDENDTILFKDYELQREHNLVFTPTAKSILLDIKLIKKVVFLGTTNFDLQTDRRHNIKYNGKHTAK